MRYDGNDGRSCWEGAGPVRMLSSPSGGAPAALPVAGWKTWR